MNRPLCRAAVRWLSASRGEGHLAPLTGQDFSALEACIHVLDLYTRSDDAGQRCSIAALRALVSAMQPHCRVFVRDVIPYVLPLVVLPKDVDKLWALISSEASS